MTADYTPLEENLGHTFLNRRLLETALIHPSFRYENEGTPDDNQRLEFLGDAVLGLTVAEYLYNRLDFIQEGTLTRLRSLITNTATLSEIARKIHLGDYMLFGRGEQKCGGAERVSTLADGLEALIGALYLDAGLKPVVRLFEHYFMPELQEALNTPETGNPKGALQEFTQKKWQTIPEYSLVAESGPPHDKRFEYEISIRGEPMGRGMASSKQQAQTLAALEAIEHYTRQGILDPTQDLLPDEADRIRKRITRTCA